MHIHVDYNILMGRVYFFVGGLSSLRIKMNLRGRYVSAPERYEVVEFDDANGVVSLEEKPSQPKSNYAVVGVYFLALAITPAFFTTEDAEDHRGFSQCASVFLNFSVRLCV